MRAYRVILRVAFWVILSLVLLAAGFWVYAIVTGGRPLSGTTLMVSRARLGSRVGDRCRCGAAVSWPQGARTAVPWPLKSGFALDTTCTRPHPALGQTPPLGPGVPVVLVPAGRVVRRDRLGGLIHEYVQVA
jgi:hypothetical protein